MFGHARCVCGPHAAPLSDASLAQSGQPQNEKSKLGEVPKLGCIVHDICELYSKTARVI